MAKKTLNIGIVGYGFMGRTHANGYHNAAKFFDTPLVPVLKAACGRDATKLKAYADNWGFESTETDWKKLVKRADIDAIDIVTPNDSHAEIAIAAARGIKHICWDGCMFPNAKLEHAQTWNAILDVMLKVRDAHGW